MLEWPNAVCLTAGNGWRLEVSLHPLHNPPTVALDKPWQWQAIKANVACWKRICFEGFATAEDAKRDCERVLVAIGELAGPK